VQDTKGAELLPELDLKRVDKVIEKGQRKEVEMYSAFYDPLKSPRCSDSGLATVLKEEGISDVYVVGLAFDYCVKATAIDAAAEGFRTVIISEGTKAVDTSTWEETTAELESKGVTVVGINGEDVKRII
jgi:nicotinamidase-related amidase